MNKIFSRIQTSVLFALCLFFAGCGKKVKPQEPEIREVYVEMPVGKSSIADLSDSDKGALDDFASKFFDVVDSDEKSKTADKVLMLTAYTSPDGTLAANRKIGLARVNSIKDYLINAGIPGTSIVVIPMPVTCEKKRGVVVEITPQSDALSKKQAAERSLKSQQAAEKVHAKAASVAKTIAKPVAKVAEVAAKSDESSSDSDA